MKKQPNKQQGLARSCCKIFPQQNKNPSGVGPGTGSSMQWNTKDNTNSQNVHGSDLSKRMHAIT